MEETTFNEDSESLEFELIYTRYNLAKLEAENKELKQRVKELEDGMCKRCKEQYYRERCDSCNLNKEK